MSRAAEDSTAQQAQGQNQTYSGNAQTAFQKTMGAIDKGEGYIDDYSNMLSKFAAKNPFTPGGEYQTSINRSTANTADAGSQAAAQAAGAEAVRTGQNSAGAVAAGQATRQANTRNLMELQAKANADRISKGAGYDSQVLGASSIPASLQEGYAGEEGKLTGTEANAGNESLGTEERANETENFGDTLGKNFAAALGKLAGGGSRG